MNPYKLQLCLSSKNEISSENVSATSTRHPTRPEVVQPEPDEVEVRLPKFPKFRKFRKLHPELKSEERDTEAWLELLKAPKRPDSLTETTERKRKMSTDRGEK